MKKGFCAIGHVVKQNLTVIILPVVRKVLNANWLPVVSHLASRAVYDLCDFVRYHKLKILNCQKKLT